MCNLINTWTAPYIVRWIHILVIRTWSRNPNARSLFLSLSFLFLSLSLSPPLSLSLSLSLSLYIYIYIDKPLVILRTSGIGCHIGSAYIGALFYADDITLLCPSIRGLNEMIVLCCEYAQEYDITLNPKKTVCIKFGSKINIDEHVSINGFLCNGQRVWDTLATLFTLLCLTHWIADTNDQCLLAMLINL